MLSFSLRGATPIWNPLPTVPAVNGNKSNWLPERSLLVARRAAVVRCWDIARDKLPDRFAREAEGLAGTSEPGLGVIFEAMLEAVEVTAMQRGRRCGRGREPGRTGRVRMDMLFIRMLALTLMTLLGTGVEWASASWVPVEPWGALPQWGRSLERFPPPSALRLARSSR